MTGSVLETLTALMAIRECLEDSVSVPGAEGYCMENRYMKKENRDFRMGADEIVRG